jgi:hypothetical protein
VRSRVDWELFAILATEFPLPAGGGFKHAGHVAFNRTNNTPACNLYVSMLPRMCLESSTPSAPATEGSLA